VVNNLLKNKADWHVFNMKGYDLVVFKGDDFSYKLTKEQLYGTFIRR